MKSIENSPDADPNIENRFGETPLLVLCDQGINGQKMRKLAHYRQMYFENKKARLDFIRNLVKHNADPSIQNYFRRTAMDVAGDAAILAALKADLSESDIHERNEHVQQVSKESGDEFIDWTRKQRDKERRDREEKLPNVRDIPRSLVRDGKKKIPEMENPFKVSTHFLLICIVIYKL